VKVLKKVVKVLVIVFSVVIISYFLIAALTIFAISQQCVAKGSSNPNHKNFNPACY
jgi:uncharacterized membrane protein (Fun14 family)